MGMSKGVRHASQCSRRGRGGHRPKEPEALPWWAMVDCHLVGFVCEPLAAHSGCSREAAFSLCSARRDWRVPPAASSWLGLLGFEHCERRREAGAGQAAMRLCGAEKRSGPGRARSALQQHTWRVCPSAARKRVASCAPGQGREHRREVGAADRRTEASRPALRRLRRRGHHAQRTLKFSNAPIPDHRRIRHESRRRVSPRRPRAPAARCTPPPSASARCRG
jgi:hypothetical protein